MSATHIRIGVFIPTGAQFLDVATVDVLGTMSKEYLSQLEMLPSHVAAAAPNVTISYITSPRQGPEIPLTSNATIKATCSYEDPSVAPGELDIVVVPGPDPRSTFEEEELKWLREQCDTPGVDILSVCTGIYICAAAGVLDGKRASGPRGLQDDIIKKYPKVKLAGEKYRWVQDGNIWSSGGVTNGNDLMAAYAKACGRWATSIAEMGAILTEVGDRSQIYGESQSRFVLGFVWTLLKAWFAGGKPSKGNKEV